MYHACILHISFFIDLKDDRVCQFLFIGTQGTDEVTEAFGKHRDGTVYQVNRCGTLFSFLIDDAALGDVVGDISNVHTYFPQAILYFTDRESIVEVLGIFRVDGESSYIPEVLALGNLFDGNLGWDSVCSFFYGRRVNVR